jgi:DNA polymerase-4
VVTSASYEARAYGVRSAMPTAQALRLCPQATVVPVPRGACVARSRDVRTVLQELAPVVQAASIDEFYLDLSGTERLFHDETLRDTAERFRREVLRRTEISVSVGGGTRPVIAKLATRRAKPAGVYVVEPGEEEAFLSTLDLADLPGVGPALVEALRKRGLVRVADALGVQLEWFQAWLGRNRGAWLHRRIRGLDDSEVDPHEARKGLRARTVTVKLRDHDFRTRVHSRTSSEPIESDAAIHEVALALLRELRSERRVPARLLGVGLSGLMEVSAGGQLGLFQEVGAGESERDRRVSHAVDALRSRFGDDAVLPGRIVDRSHRHHHPSDDEESGHDE